MRTVSVFTCSSFYEIPEECVRDICRPGRNDDAVSYWSSRIEWDSLADPDSIRAELKETGGWSADDLRDDDANRCRFLWILAWNAHDALHDEDAVTVRRMPRHGLT
jgi:hypothetical protein